MHVLDGEAVGAVERVVVGRGDKVPAAVVGVGGVLGLGERHVVIPLGELRRADDGRLTVGLTGDQVKSLPVYDGELYDPASGVGRSGGPAAAR